MNRKYDTILLYIIGDNMNEKKTVLFLMNGFGPEVGKSYELYSKEVMPTFSKLITAYPFKLLHASGLSSICVLFIVPKEHDLISLYLSNLILPRYHYDVK